MTLFFRLLNPFSVPVSMYAVRITLFELFFLFHILYSEYIIFDMKRTITCRQIEKKEEHTEGHNMEHIREKRKWIGRRIR